jgi:hypothetical protein
MNESTLRDGCKVPDILVESMMFSLRRLLADQPAAFYELTEMCRHPGHAPSGNAGMVLAQYGLTSSGQIHDAVRHIVLSAVTGEGFGQLVLGSPLAGDPSDE